MAYLSVGQQQRVAIARALAVCVSVPLITWRRMEQRCSIVERIKGIE